MGSGTDVAQAAADFLLLSSDLDAINAALSLARKTRAVMRQNLLWALAYNLLAVPLAALGFVTPLVATIGMSGSSLIVAANALRLAPLSRTREGKGA